MGFYFNVIGPLLPSLCGFSFVLGHRVSFFFFFLFCGFQHLPVESCLAASCNFVVLTGEVESIDPPSPEALIARFIYL